MHSDETILTISKYAARIGVDGSTVRRWLLAGLCPQGVKRVTKTEGGHWRLVVAADSKEPASDG
jgi:hypothetical protein